MMYNSKKDIPRYHTRWIVKIGVNSDKDYISYVDTSTGEVFKVRKQRGI